MVQVPPFLYLFVGQVGCNRGSGLSEMEKTEKAGLLNRPLENSNDGNKSPNQSTGCQLVELVFQKAPFSRPGPQRGASLTLSDLNAPSHHVGQETALQDRGSKAKTLKETLQTREEE